MKRIPAIFAAAAALCAIPAWAKTYYVDAKYGSDYNTGLKESQALKTIQAAIDKAAAGSTILVYPGTYEPLRTSKKLTIKSTGGAEDTVVDGSLAEKYTPPTVNAPSWVQVNYKWEYNPDTCQYEKTDKVESYYYYDGNGEYHDWFPPVDESIWDKPYPKEKTSKVKWGKSVYREGETRFTGACVVLGKVLYHDGILYYSDGYEELERGKRFSPGTASISGFTLRNARYGVLGGSASYCVISGISEVAAGMSSLTDSEICGNELRYVSTGCCGAIATASTLNRCQIHDNTLQDNVGLGTALSFECDFDATLQCYDNAGGFYTKPSSIANSLVFKNTVLGGENGWWNPFVSIDAYNCTIADNVLCPNGEAVGVDCWNECGNVFNSIVWGNIDAYGNPANVKKVHDEITGRTVAADYMNYNSSWNGEPWVYKPRVSMMNSLTDIPIEQKGNGKGYMISGGWWDEPIWTYKVTYKNSTGNISGDPCFIDPEHGDYHLAPWSPCIDMGADYQSKTGKFDLDSAARKVGKVDMGAYELQPRMAVPADYDGDGITDAAFYFAASGQWWVFKNSDGKIRAVSMPDANATPCPADYDGDGKAEPAYYTAADKTPEFVRVKSDGKAVRSTFGEKGATPVAARLAKSAKATFGTYTANAKKPAFSFLGSPLKVEFGAKASRPVVADFDNDGKDDLGVYTAAASKPAFSILQSSQGYSPSALFNGGAVALGPKGAIPCCADYDGKGGADFGVYTSNTKEPYFQRLFSSSKFRETRTLPMGSKGDVPVVGVYEEGQPAAPAIWTGSVWTYLGSDWEDRDLVGE